MQGRQVEFPPAKFTGPIDQFRGILASEIPGLVGEIGLPLRNTNALNQLL